MRRKTDAFLLLLFIISCTYSCSDKSGVAPSGEEEPSRFLTINTRSAADMMSNMRVYIFNGGNDQFVKQAFNIERSTSSIKLPIQTGFWNLALLSVDRSGDNLDGITPPIAGTVRSSLPLWTTQSVGENLKDATPILMGTVVGQTITANVNHTAALQLQRPAAQIKVVMTDGVGFDVANVGHTVSLLNVPTTLSWTGKLMPNATSPLVGTMKRSMVLRNHATAEHQKSDTIFFVVPAQLQTNDADTLKQKLKIRFELFRPGASTPWNSPRGDIDIDFVPKANTTLIVNVRCNGAFEIATSVLPWEVEASTISPTQLYNIAPITTTGTTALFNFLMKGDLAWSVSLQNTTQFEFTEDSAISGNATYTYLPIKIQRKAGVVGTISTNVIFRVAGMPDRLEAITLN